MRRISLWVCLLAATALFWRCASHAPKLGGPTGSKRLPPAPEKSAGPGRKTDSLPSILPTAIPPGALADTSIIKPSNSAGPDSSDRKTPAPDSTAPGALATPDPDTTRQDSTAPGALAAPDLAENIPEKPQIPLICVANPGSMEGSGERGEYILTGEVKCQYGRLNFETGKAVWDRRRNQVNCEGGMKVLLDEMVLVAETGGYDQASSLVWARGKVRGGDTANQYDFTSGHLTYHRESHDMNLTVSPVLRRFYRDSSSTAPDSSMSGGKRPRVDTLEIRARKIIYNDSTRTAWAEKDVRIIRGNLTISGTKGFFDEKSEIITLSGEPVALLHDNEMKGDAMLVALKGEEVKSLALIGNALALYYNKDKKSLSQEQYLLEGDSLFMNIIKEKMDFIEVFRKGNASHIFLAHPDKIDNMKGRYLRLNFKAEKILSASAVGNAGSTYFYFDDSSFKGKNIAQGDSIGIFFKDGKLSNIRITGKAEGTYLGESSQPDTTSAKDSLTEEKN